MDHVLTEYGLRLTYLCDPTAMETIDQDRILDDLFDDMPDGDPIPWLTRHRFADYDHLILVTDRRTGQHLGFLGVTDRETTQEPFLYLEAAFVTPKARGQHLLRRMIALTLLRIGGHSAAPAIIAGYAQQPILRYILHDLAAMLPNATFFPEQGKAAVNFNAAALAQRISRITHPNHRIEIMTGQLRPRAEPERLLQISTPPLSRNTPRLAIADLRREPEAAIFEAARHFYRSR